MKIAVTKIGGTLLSGSHSTTGGTAEAICMIEMMSDTGNQVDAFCRNPNGPTDVNGKYTVYDIESNYDMIINGGYDAFLIFNGAVTYFGGADKPEYTIVYKVINNFKGKVFWLSTDLGLNLIQIWGAIARKPWHDRYKEEDIVIKRDDIIYICQANKPEVVVNEVNKSSGAIQIKNYGHFNFEKFPLYAFPDYKNYSEYNEHPLYDLSYGGTFRQGRREMDMIKFYFGYPDDISVEMFGKISEKNFNPKKVANLRKPEFGPAIKTDMFKEKMNKNAMSTVIISDPLYKKTEQFTLRIYESILAKVVTFIDISYDPDKKLYHSDELKDFLYVKDRKDVAEKIRRLKEDDSFRRHIVELQLDDIDFNRDDYRNEFFRVIGEFL